MGETFKRIKRAGAILSIPLVLSTCEKEKMPQPSEAEASQALPSLEELKEEMFWRIFHPEQKGEVRLGLEEVEEIKEYWKREYTENFRLRESLAKGYQAMQLYIQKLREIFRQKGVPGEYIFLALGESHWDPEAVSPQGAIGAFQVLPSTAKRFGFIKEDLFDPLENAKVAAENLAYLYDIFGDWDLVLSGYNGGFTWQYKEQRSPANRSYEDFLTFLAGKINDIRCQLNEEDLIHLVEKGQTLLGLSRYYGVELEELKKLNGLKSEKIYRGQKLLIPRSEKALKRFFYKNGGGILENLKYPPKFDAIYELIERDYVQSE